MSESNITNIPPVANAQAGPTNDGDGHLILEAAAGVGHPETINWADYPGVKRRILAPVDGSESCQRALNWFLKHVHREGDFLVFVHVISPDILVRLHGSTPVTVDLDQQHRESMDESMQTARHLRDIYQQWAEKNQVQVAFLFYVSSRAGEAIEVATRATKVDAILMGNRGHGTLRRTFLGSVTDYVLHHAHIPLIVIPPGF